VIFIDEAYQLVVDRQGQQVLNFILPLAESLHGDFGALVWVFAGYKSDMEKLFEHNIGLPSRFPIRFHFEDYSDAEHLKMFHRRLLYEDMAVAPADPKPALTTISPPRPPLRRSSFMRTDTID
jgi:hypothetical protein